MSSSTVPSAEPPQITRRSAKVVLNNCTGSYFKFQVLHEYSDEQTNDSAFTTGYDGWKVHGTRLVEVSGDSGAAKLFGKFFIDGLPYHSGSGLFAKWKRHTLRAEDEGKEIIIRVYQSEVQFISPSGRSTTTFETFGQDILPLAANQQR